MIMKSIIDYFEERAIKFGENPLIWEKTSDKYESTSYKEAYELIKKYAAGLINAGIKKGDRIALLSEGRKDWLICELAILYTGAINVPLSSKLDGDNDLVFRIHHSESRFVITSKNQIQKIRKIKDKLPLVEKIIIFDTINDLKSKELLWDEIKRTGEFFISSSKKILTDRRKEVKHSDIANISYTSGTTADPKGIVLSHRNYTANVEQAFSFIDIPHYFKTLLVLPWDHAFAHTAGLYAFIYKGASIACVQVGKTPNETLRNFTTNLLEINSDAMLSVPSLAKNFKKNIEKGVQNKGKFAWKLFQIALKHGYWYNGTGNNKGKGLKILTRPLGLLFDMILFKKIRLRFGKNFQYFIGGGALLDIDLQRFFYTLGIPMYQGYGLSEASPIISANTPDFHKLGSSGKVVQQLKIRICDENGNNLPVGQSGEIVVKGENVMLGYWKNETATNEAIRDGWLFTGDLGYLDKENYLYVLGRFKSLLISFDGEKYSPEGIEEAIIDNCPLIDQFLLYNNQSPYTIGLVVPNADKMKHLKKENFSEEENAKNILTEIIKEISEFKTGGKYQNMFPQRWLPTTILILPEPLTETNKMLNSSMKVVRKLVETTYKNEIEFLFTPEGKDIYNKKNVEGILGY